MRQRQSPALVCAALLAGAGSFAAEPSPCPPPQVHALPVHPVSIAEAHGRLVISMGMRGVVVADPYGAYSPELHEGLPALATAELPDGEVAMAGRDHTIRVARLAESGTGLDLRLAWPAEGIPTGIAWREGLIAVGAGGAGISLFCWDDREQVATLCGRYPFPGFVREVAFVSDTILVAADSHTAGMWVLDVSDPRRPRRVAHHPVASYCDAVATAGREVYFSDRNTGFLRYHTQYAAIDGVMVRAGFLTAPASNSPDNDAMNIVLGSDGHTLATVFRVSGVQVHTRANSNGDWQLQSTVRMPGATIDAALLECGCLAVISMAPNRLRIVHPEGEMPAPPE